SLGYREVVAARDTLLLRAGERARGHEFHYSCFLPGRGGAPAYQVAGRQPPAEGYARGNLLASYIHVHCAGQPLLAQRFAAGCAVVLDVAMVAAGVASGPLVPLGCPLHVAVAAAEAAERARVRGTTRAAAGMATLAPLWAGGVVAVGNAPTALLALLDLVDA